MLTASCLVPALAQGEEEIHGDWTHEITTDPTDGVVTCTVQKGQDSVPFPWFYYRSGSGISVAVVGDMSIGEAQTFRVDDHEPIAESDRLTGARARQLIAEVRAGGKTLHADFVRFPSGDSDTLKVDLKGVIPHLDACKAATQKAAAS